MSARRLSLTRHKSRRSKVRSTLPWFGSAIFSTEGESGEGGRRERDRESQRQRQRFNPHFLNCPLNSSDSLLRGDYPLSTMWYIPQKAIFHSFTHRFPLCMHTYRHTVFTKMQLWYMYWLESCCFLQGFILTLLLLLESTLGGGVAKETTRHREPSEGFWVRSGTSPPPHRLLSSRRLSSVSK